MSRAGDVSAGIVSALGRAADAVDARCEPPGPVAAAWGFAKLAAAAIAAPVAVPLAAALAARNTAHMHRLTERYPELVARALAGEPVPPLERVGHIPAGAPAVISSDLHRCVAGTVDWPAESGTGDLYAALLDHYAVRDWHLVENGDVEDHWLVGGSTYGVVYDLARTVAELLPGATGRAARASVYGEHLARIVTHNGPIYRRIQEGFHVHGRYHRVIGNHDDAYGEADVAEHLRVVHPGLEVLDGVVLVAAAGPPGVVTHGHHTDPWNAAGSSLLGRLTTSLGCALSDAPIPVGMPGKPTASASEALLGGEQQNLLTEVDPRFGANAGMYSLDEVELFGAFRQRWPGGAAGQPEPWLVLGHTHLPLREPRVPPGTARATPAWERYVNGGSGVGVGVVTVVEWEPTSDGPAQVRLVAWFHPRAGSDDDVVGTDPAGRPVARRVLGPSADRGTLEFRAG